MKCYYIIIKLEEDFLYFILFLMVLDLIYPKYSKLNNTKSNIILSVYLIL